MRADARGSSPLWAVSARDRRDSRPLLLLPSRRLFVSCCHRPSSPAHSPRRFRVDPRSSCETLTPAVNVFPTGVGMDRYPSSTPRTLKCVPHGRGDGPALGSSGLFGSACSSRAWGWTGIAENINEWLKVFPTGVGMDRDMESHHPSPGPTGLRVLSCFSPASIPSGRGWGGQAAVLGLRQKEVIAARPGRKAPYEKIPRLSSTKKKDGDAADKSTYDPQLAQAIAQRSSGRRDTGR
jgi:hypothetical protein